MSQKSNLINQVIPYDKWKSWRFKNTSLLVLSLIVLVYLSKTTLLDSALHHIGNLGYVGAFISGLFFVSTFTVVPAAVVLFHLAENYNVIVVALIAGFGAMIGDYFIFKLMKDKVFAELWPLFDKVKVAKIRVLFRSPYFVWLLPVVGAFVIASPLPDEVGVSMMGLSKIKQWQFFFLAFTLNAIGIFLVVTAAKLR